ncbi:hypothetical protein [Priestia aryabhattai]|uniref:hypothetical protein n=1 Tax=Priestia aryabhattai TaxID=412384 RepID=UPI0015F49C74|nr:hypothetical protein [Priestia aryabhattai]
MKLQFRARDKVIVEGKKDIGVISSANIKEHLDHNGEVVYEEKYYVRFSSSYSHWYKAEDLKLSIENMDYIDPKQLDKINKLLIDAHIDNKDFKGVKELGIDSGIIKEN